MATKPKTGRPSDYLPEVAADICSLLADGESLRKVCELPGMPNKATVFRWLAQHRESGKYRATLTRNGNVIFRKEFGTLSEATAAVEKARCEFEGK
ncbi:hypothetical protein ACXWZO_002561 [Enterobacter hormaechei]